jgi:glucose/arabinose dehydrogenase
VLSAPAPLATGLTGALLVTATTTGAAAVQFQIDGANLAEISTPPFQVAIPDTGAYASGQHVLGVRARDGAGAYTAWSQAVVSFGGSVARPAGFSLATLTGALNAATAFAVAPDGRLFVCEQAGTLRVFKNGALLATPFATLATSANGERGLLGVAFDPAFAANGYVYVYYTSALPAPHNRVSRITADPANPDLMKAGTELALVDLPDLSSATNHNGGALHFGPDGKLYVGVGENANGANAQSMATTLGKLLRFNPDGSIPTDNPFYATASGANRAIWALGLRNPFTFGFQPGTTRLHINDVGQSTWEEINLGSAGANYGWPTVEGKAAPPNAAFTDPLFAFGHPSAPAGQPGSTGTFLQGIAILGAAFDPPGSLWSAPYQGSYYFADYTGGWIARLHLASGTVSTFSTGFGPLADLAFGTDGSLYVLGRSGVQKISHP